MNDDSQPPANPGKTDSWMEPGATNVQIIYILYLAGFIVGLTPVIGVVIAHMNKGKSEGWVTSHYTWLIRTFWIGLLYGFISFLLAFVLIGFLLMLATAVWVIIRCVLGLQSMSRSEPMKNPDSWLI